MLAVDLKEPADFLRIVLAVAVECDGIGEPHVHRLTETSLQGRTLTAVLRECHQCDTIETTEDTGRRVCTAVVHHDHIVAFRQRLLDHPANGPAVVIRRNHHTDSPVTEYLFLPILVYR